jgi:hypothetical protein
MFAVFTLCVRAKGRDGYILKQMADEGPVAAEIVGPVALLPQRNSLPRQTRQGTSFDSRAQC